MPQVPDLVPTVQPSGAAPEINLPVPVDAFGGAVAHALEGFGGQIERSSDQIWQRAMDMQNLNNETSAKEADAKYMMESGKLHADFINKEGLNAGPEALAQHIQQLQDLRTQIRQGLNPMAARMYDASSLSFMGRNIFNAAGHSGQQVKVASNNAATSRKEIMSNSIEANPDDETSFQRITSATRAENARIGANLGWSPDQVEATNQEDLSKNWAKRIISTGNNQGGALKAQSMLNWAVKNKAIDPVTADRVQASITTKIGDQGSRYITDKVLADRRAGQEEDEQSEDYYIDKGMAEVDAVKGLNQDQREYLRDRTRQAIAIKYKQQRQIETDSDNENVRTIGRALIRANAAGSPPTTVEEMMTTDPKVGPAWDAVQRDPAKAQAILKQLEHNAAGTSRVPTTQQNLILTHQYIGMSQAADDNTRAGFMAQNFGADNRLSIPQRERLMNLQDQMRKGTATDPRVARAMTILEPDLKTASYPVEKKSGDDYYQFKGALTDALEQFQHDHPGKTPTLDEVRQIGSQLMQEQASHWWQSHEAFYQMQASKEDRDRISKLPVWRGTTPNDGQINRYYRAELYQQKYGKKGETP